MSDRLVLVVVCLLLLVVTCALLLSAFAWVPSRFRKLDERLSRIDEIGAQVSVMHDRLAELDRLEKKLSEAATSSVSLTRIDSSVDTLRNDLKDVGPAVKDLKDSVALKTDLDRLSQRIAQLERKLTDAAPKSDPGIAPLAKNIADLRELVEATRKLLDSSTRDISKDLKQMHLEIQKIQQK